MGDRRVSVGLRRFCIGAITASLLSFAVIAKIVPYFPDPHHRLLLSISKLWNESRKDLKPCATSIPKVHANVVLTQAIAHARVPARANLFELGLVKPEQHSSSFRSCLFDFFVRPPPVSA